MTPDAFRQLALFQSNARMASRLGAVEFLVGDKVFATLGADPTFAIVRLSLEDQRWAIKTAPAVFSPQAGGAGARGVTCVRLAMAEDHHLKPVLAKAANKARNAKSALSQLGFARSPAPPRSSARGEP